MAILELFSHIAMVVRARHGAVCIVPGCVGCCVFVKTLRSIEVHRKSVNKRPARSWPYLGVVVYLAQLLQVSLTYQAFNIALSDIELAVLGQSDGTIVVVPH